MLCVVVLEKSVYVVGNTSLKTFSFPFLIITYGVYRQECVFGVSS